MSASISACLIARDEEADLPRCLASLAGVAGEIVVVDTGSRDRTPQLAAAAGARVLRAAWRDDFSAARNVALEAATLEWCLVLDADEELPPETRAGLAAEVERAERAGLQGISLVMRNLHPPADLSSWLEHEIVRLFRRDARFRYEGAIHEQVTPAIVRAGGRIGRSPLRIVHHGYARKTAQGGVDRARRNLDALAAALRARPDDAYLVYQLGVTLKSLGDPAAASHLGRALALDDAGPGALSAECTAIARMKLAQLALERGADGEAAAEARRCLALDPGNVAALQILGLVSFAQGRLDEAAAALRALLAAPSLAPQHRADVSELLRMADAERGPA